MQPKKENKKKKNKPNKSEYKRRAIIVKSHAEEERMFLGDWILYIVPQVVFKTTSEN